MTVELEEHCFRVEKRSRERLITYPIYEVYAYLKYKKAAQTNVVFFNKKEQVNKDFLTEIDNFVVFNQYINFLQQREDIKCFHLNEKKDLPQFTTMAYPYRIASSNSKSSDNL